MLPPKAPLSHPYRPLRRLFGGAAVLSFAVAAPAQAACPTTATTKAFSRLGDSANYTLLSGANFETGASGWSLGGASIVSGTSSVPLGATSDAKSLRVPAKARTLSPKFCVGVEHPTFRLVARSAGRTWATLLVKVRWTDARGVVNETTLGSLNSNGYASWAATPPIALATALPLWQSGQSVTAQLVLDPEDYGGDWQVDDIYIDPFRRT
ncbi:MAG: hypothetical protein J7513_09540 [Solirubrobacteraceae bacterium]|nr:hypothetical protein [Solirubrobacteraceae bacterium]